MMTVGQPNNQLHILRTGACDIVDAAGTLVERTEPGGSFGASSLLSRAPSRYDITTIEDSLVLVMGPEVFHHLVDHYDAVRTFYDAQARGRLREAIAVQNSAQDRSAAWLRTRVDDLGTREPICATSDTSIREAAQLMTRHRISALLVVDDGRLSGIVTDRDLRSKVVAAGVDVELPLSEVMTPQPVQVEPGTQAFEALLEMTTRGVHHLPVVAEGRVLGVVTAGDIVRLQQADPVFMVGDISRQRDVESLARTSQRSHQLVAQLLRQDASSDDITRLLTTVADAITRRLIGFAVDELGPEPGPWAWITLGSQARREISVNSDQDHAIVIADSVVLDEAAGAWFAGVAERVTAGLEACGYARCNGDVMASNPAWRKTVAQWRRQFAHWVNEPDPDAVMHCQIFFDARTVHGDPSLLAEVRQDVLAATPASKRFLGQLATQAVERQPPVGFFRGFVLARRGEEHDSFDLKGNGVHAIIEIARVHALAHGLDQVGTLERLHTLSRLTESQSFEELADAFEFVSHVRLAHQARQMAAGQRVDNLVRAEELTSFDKRHLKDAFSLVRTAQEGLAYTYQTHLMS